MATQRHYVTFYSPGTFVHETRSVPIDSWSTEAAADMAKGVVERHGATPFAFSFETYTESDDIDDGKGGKLKVRPRLESRSGRYYIDGKLLTIDDVEALGPEYRILLANMRSNGWDRVVEMNRGYRIVQTFDADDAIVDERGRVTERG